MRRGSRVIKRIFIGLVLIVFGLVLINPVNASCTTDAQGVRTCISECGDPSCPNECTQYNAPCTSVDCSISGTKLTCSCGIGIFACGSLVPIPEGCGATCLDTYCTRCGLTCEEQTNCSSSPSCNELGAQCEQKSSETCTYTLNQSSCSFSCSTNKIACESELCDYGKWSNEINASDTGYGCCYPINEGYVSGEWLCANVSRTWEWLNASARPSAIYSIDPVVNEVKTAQYVEEKLFNKIQSFIKRMFTK